MKIRWFLDKNSKIPLYIQLKDLIKYYISTGEIKNDEQLPGVVVLSKELQINFETVRKAYKELEKEGLAFMKRGKGSFAILPDAPFSGSGEVVDTNAQAEPEVELKHAIRRLFKEGRSEADIKSQVNRSLQEASAESRHFFLIFTECSKFQVNEISAILRQELKVEVKPVLVSELKKEIDRLAASPHDLLAVVTTGFHLNEVRRIIDHKPIDIQILITHMSPETRLRLSSFGKSTKFGFICRDLDSIAVYTDVIKTELGEDIKLSSCLISDEALVEDILRSVDVLLVTPSAYEVIKPKTPEELPVFNVFDCIDPVSLKIVQAAISRRLESAIA